MQTWRVAAVGVTCALALSAADFWKTKDSSQWSSEEIDKILNDSPWAKAKKIEPQQDMRRRGGIGFPGGYPGGYPGGGYPNGGGNYPNGRGNRGDPPRVEPMNLTIRWDSAAPVEAALMRRSGVEGGSGGLREILRHCACLAPSAAA